LASWLTDARNLTHPNTVIMLVGNKSDCTEQREVSFEEATRFAEENGMCSVYITAN
jgi:Ras-related protein Rab-14